jgi:YegS/Rv2252/BmrU family lipid kinase
MKILTFINPCACDGKTLRMEPKIKNWLSKTSHEFLFMVSSSPEEMRMKMLDAKSNGFDAIYLIGGDGTIHEALPSIAKMDLPFGIIPIGRGNDFARNIRISRDVKENCIIPQHPMIHKIDLPTINGIPFGSIASLGFDATVSKLAHDHRGYFGGTLGYIICVLKALRSFKPFSIDITIDDYNWKGRISMIAMANGPYYGGGMKIAPQAVMNDGKITMCIVRELSSTELLQQFPKVFKGTHVSHPSVYIRSGRQIQLSAENHQEIFADGEHCGTLPAICKIGNQMVKIILPK